MKFNVIWYCYSLVFLMIFSGCRSAEQGSTSERLENTYWKLTEINLKTVTTPADKREVHIILQDDGQEKRLKGFAGCNSVMGSYFSDDKSISFQAGSTKMYCEGSMEIENQFFDTLQKADNYKIIGKNLSLFQKDELLAKFEAVHLK